MAFEIATERVSEALETVKHDLMKVREEDDQLTRQLLNINATIKRLTSKTSRANTCSTMFCSCGKAQCHGKRIISASAMKKIDTPLPLTNTLAAFRRLSIGSTGSDSDISHSDEEFSDCDNEVCEIMSRGEHAVFDNY